MYGPLNRGIFMRRTLFRPSLVTCLLPVAVSLAACSTPASGPDGSAADATIFEGARLVVGDGNVYDTATRVVAGRTNRAGRPEWLTGRRASHRVSVSVYSQT